MDQQGAFAAIYIGRIFAFHFFVGYAVFQHDKSEYMRYTGTVLKFLSSIRQRPNEAAV